MGNSIDRSVMGALDGHPRHEFGNQCTDEKLSAHIYFYKMELPLKDRQALEWATAKLKLTEELINGAHNQRYQNARNCFIADEDDDIENEDSENELTNLELYREKLVEIIQQIETANKRRREMEVQRQNGP